MKVLVTGGNGFIGSYLVEGLLERGDDVIALVRGGSNLCNLEGCRVDLARGDIRAKKSLYPVLAGVDFIYHTAALKFCLKPEDFYSINQLGTRNLLEAVAETGTSLKGFVYISSLAAAGPSRDNKPLREDDPCRPITHYGKSKLLGEQEVLRWREKIPVVIVRPAAVYGPRDRDIYLYFKWAKKGISARARGNQQLSLSYVPDLVKGILQAGERGKRGSTYFLADGTVYSWDEIDTQVASALGRRLIKLTVPRFLFPAIGLACDTWGKLAGNPLVLNSEKLREIREPAWTCDVGRAREELGFTPEHSLGEGIRETIAWYEERHWL